jgi:hypothetical protein
MYVNVVISEKLFFRQRIGKAINNNYIYHYYVLKKNLISENLLHKIAKRLHKNNIYGHPRVSFKRPFFAKHHFKVL